jgi:transposase
VVVGTQALLLERDAEIRQLRAQLSETLAELSATRAELAAIRAQSHATSQQIGLLAEQVAKGNDRIAELLAIAQRKKRSSGRTEKAKVPAEPPPVDELARKAFEDRPQPPPEPGALHDRPREKQRPTGRKPLPAHLPTDESTVYPDRCSCGCTAFDHVDEVVEQKLHVRSHQRNRLTRRKTGRCRDCGRRTTAEAPPSPFARSKVTPEWLAWFIVQKFQLIVPLDRIRRYLGLQGIVLAKSFLVSQTEAAADLLAAIDGEHWKQLMQSPHLASDGTGLKVQVPGVGLHHGYMEVYHWGDLVIMQYTDEKGGETQAAKLLKYHGTLLVDAESRYNETIKRNSRIIESNCNAHPRRAFRDAEAVQPILAVEGGRFVSAMFEAEALAKEKGLTGEALLAWRQAEIGPITERFRGWMDAVEPTLLRSDAVAKIIRYYRNHWAELMRFLSDPELPLDNSASEREFQPIAKMRLNCLFAGGTEGAHRAAILFGLAATCRRQQVDFEAWMTWVFIRQGTHAHKYNLTAAELTPAAYKRALAQA